MTKSSCPLCTQFAKFSFKKDGYTYKRCTNCGTLFVADILNPEEIHMHYSQDYFEAASANANPDSERRGYPSYREAENSLKNSFRHKLSYVLSHSSHGHLLEIGAAYGTFITLAKDYFTCSGLDVSNYAAEVAREQFGHNIIQGDIEKKIPFEDNSFDIIVMWDVIEHLIEPIQGVNEIFRVLKPGGKLFFSTDDAGNWLPRLLSSQWWALAAPLHLCHFSKNGTKALLQRVGKFDNIEIVSDKRVYGIGEVVSHFGVSYKNKFLISLGNYLNNTSIGSLLITVTRPEQFIVMASKAT